MTPARPRTTVFIGGGRITRALLAGLKLKGFEGPILVHDRNPRKLQTLRRQFEVAVEPILFQAVQQADILVIAVRPQDVRELLQQITETPSRVAISLAAGIPLRNLRGWMGGRVMWARAMPSPVARNGRGLTALTFERGVRITRRREVRDFFAQVGGVIEIPEREFDAFTTTYSSSHGYHALAALANGAQKLGLDRKTALTAAAHALADGILAWRDGNISLEDLQHEAATPGGIAAETLTTMDKSGYRQIVERGLRAGMARARKNAKR